MGVLAKKGINSFKFFMAYKGALQVTNEELMGIPALQGARRTSHGETGQVRH